MKTLEEIRQLLRSHAGELEERYGITQLSLFGSFVRGEAREDSDVDVVADIPLSINFIKLMEIELYLSDVVGEEIDLVPRGEIRRELRDAILGEAVPV